MKKTSKGISATAFMATFSTARELFAQRDEPASQPEVISVDRWIDGQWVKKFYAKDGESYTIDVSEQYNQDGSRRWNHAL